MSYSLGLESGLKTCICNKLPALRAAGPGQERGTRVLTLGLSASPTTRQPRTSGNVLNGEHQDKRALLIWPGCGQGEMRASGRRLCRVLCQRRPCPVRSKTNRGQVP